MTLTIKQITSALRAGGYTPEQLFAVSEALQAAVTLALQGPRPRGKASAAHPDGGSESMRRRATNPYGPTIAGQLRLDPSPIAAAARYDVLCAAGLRPSMTRDRYVAVATGGKL